MRAGFRSALQSGLEHHGEILEIDGTIVALAFAGAGMAEATLPALAPLVGNSESAARPTAAATLTVELWDSASSRVRPAPAPWGQADGGPLGAVREFNDETRKAVVDAGSRTVTVADLTAGHAVVWAACAAALPDWWRAVPLRLLLSWVLTGPARHVVHAGAVGAGGRGVLLAGAGGAGKSTLAVTCVEAGMDYIGDDYLLLSSGTPPRAHALYGTAKLDRHSLGALPGLAPQAGAVCRAGDKAVIDLNALRPDRLCAALAVEAIVVPRLAGGARPALVPISGASALRAVAPSTIFQAPDGAAPALDVLADVVRTVPSYELRIDGKADLAADLLRSALETETFARAGLRVASASG
jgi:hypothetical protein